MMLALVPVQLCRMHVFVSDGGPRHDSAEHLRLRNVVPTPQEVLHDVHKLQGP